jgi:hypothetical protein
MAAHHLSADIAWGAEVSLSRLSSLTGNSGVSLHIYTIKVNNNTIIKARLTILLKHSFISNNHHYHQIIQLFYSF